MKVKEESKKASLKLNIQQTKTMASVPITWWQIDAKTMETVRDFIFFLRGRGSKITADCDCSHEIKRHLLLGRKAMTKPSTVQCSCPVLSDSLQPHEPQHARPPCPSQTPGVHPNRIHWFGDAIQPSHPLSSPSPPAPTPSQHQGLFQWKDSRSGGLATLCIGCQSTGVSPSVSVLPKNTQDWSLGWTGWIFWQSKGLLRVFSKTIVQKHQFFGAQLSSQSNSHIHTWPLEKP